MARNQITGSNRRFLLRNMGTSLFLNGSSDLATCPITPSTSGISFSFWINFNRLTGQQRILTWSASGPNGGFIIEKSTNAINLTFAVYNGASLQTSGLVSNNVVLGRWTHFAFTFTTNEAKVYQNGALINSDTSCTMSTPAAQTLTIGSSSASPANFFSGLIDELIIHNTDTPWTEDEVKKIYYEGYVPTGCNIYLLNNSVVDQNGANGLTLTGTSYSSNVSISNRTSASNRFIVRPDTQYGVVFNGSTDYISINSQLFYQNSGYSVSFWVRGDLNSSGQRILCLASTASNNQVWILENKSSSGGRKLALFIRNDANGDISPASPFSNSIIFDGKWHHIVLTDNNGTVKMYVDGVLDGNTFDYTPSGVFTLNRTGFGALVRGTATTFMKGSGKDLRIFNNTVLTEAQAQAIYYKGLNPANTITTWWKMNEGSGATVSDSSGNGNDGSITGATYSSTDVPYQKRTAIT